MARWILYRFSFIARRANRGKRHLRDETISSYRYFHELRKTREIYGATDLKQKHNNNGNVILYVHNEKKTPPCRRDRVLKLTIYEIIFFSNNKVFQT